MALLTHSLSMLSLLSFRDFLSVVSQRSEGMASFGFTHQVIFAPSNLNLVLTVSCRKDFYCLVKHT